MRINTLIYFISFYVITNLTTHTCTNSYIYLNDQQISEEIPIGSFVVDLNRELEIYNKTIKNPLAHETVSNQQFTLLEDSKVSSNGNAYFEMASGELPGQLITKRLIDREYMCLNRQCSEPCEQQKGVNFGSCKINLKVLMLPSYNILNLNILIQDINDNRPVFRTNSIVQQISENVPVGYKIPIDLAYDPDIGRNKIQTYEITEQLQNSEQAKQQHSTFKLAQTNPNEPQLHLVVANGLDREKISTYSFRITAYDGGSPPLNSSLNVIIQITDINDNNPIFEKLYYKFSVEENAPVDTVLGSVRANDLDADLNGLVKYSIEDNANLAAALNGHPSSNRFLMQRGNVATKNFLKNFDLDESTGVIRLKSLLDYENEKHFVFTVEARDGGVGSLPSYATVEINVIDVNDNAPEISVSFLNTLAKNRSLISGYKYDVYLPENTKSNKFLAHVNINDKDSNENGRFDWLVLVNNQQLANSSSVLLSSSAVAETYSNSIVKIIRLNNNSFTLNVASSSSPLLLDRELCDRHNVSLIAWDYGSQNHQFNKTYFNFSIVLLDVNDNAPRFEQATYELSIYENNEPHQAIFTVRATDADSPGVNSNVSYTFKENDMINEYLSIDSHGVITSRVGFDREKCEKFLFHVVAFDEGEPSMSSTAQLILNILDVNDNKPAISFNTSFYHRFQKLENTTTTDYILYIKVGENLSTSTRLIDFRAVDKDINENAKVEFYFDSKINDTSTSTAGLSAFKLDRDGLFTLTKRLERSKQTFYYLTIVCRDFGREPTRLSSSLQLTVEVVDSSEFCIRTKEDSSLVSKHKFFNRDSLIDYDLFTIDYMLKDDNGDDQETNSIDNKINNNKNTLSFELMTHRDLFEIRFLDANKEISTTSLKESKTSQYFYRLEIKFNETLSRYNLSRLMLGKYAIKVKLLDNVNPTCSNLEQFTLIVGNNHVSEKEIVNYLRTYRNSKNVLFFNDDYLDNSDDPSSSISSSNDEESDSSSFDQENGLVLSANADRTSLNSLQSKEPKYRVKPATFMDSDYILLFILIIIVIITSILLAFIGVICVCSRLKKKQYKKNVNTLNNNNNNRKNVSELDELADLADTNQYILAKSSLTSSTTSSQKKSRQKPKKSNKSLKPDLNTSSSSGASQDKTHYTLVHNSKNTSNSASSTTSSTNHTGTILYRDDDDDDDDFGIISASVCPIRQFSSRDKTHTSFNQHQHQHHHNHNQLKYQQQQQQQSHPHYIYSSTTMATVDHNTSSFDESNSNPESVIDTTTIDDSKSSSLNNDYELNNPLSVVGSAKANTASKRPLTNYQLQTKNETTSSVSSHSSSSAYSSISTSENGAGSTSETAKLTEPCELNLNKQLQTTNFLSFKKAAANPNVNKNSNTLNKNISTMNSYSSSSRNRTSFNL